MAMGLARLGAPVAFVGKVGDDLFGRYCLEDMASRGIDVSRVVRDSRLKTGVTVSISHPGDRALVTHLGAIGALTGADVPDAALPVSTTCTSPPSSSRRGSASTWPLSSRARTGRGSRPRSTPGSTQRALGRGPARRAARDRSLLPERGRARGAQRLQRPGFGPPGLANGVTRVVAKLGEQGAMTLDGDTIVRVPAYRARRSTRPGPRLVQRRLPPPLARRGTAPRVPAARGGLRRAQHAGARRHRGQPTLTEAEALVRSRA